MSILIAIGIAAAAFGIAGWLEWRQGKRNDPQWRERKRYEEDIWP